MKLPITSTHILFLQLACVSNLPAMEISKATIHIPSRKNQVADLTKLLAEGADVDSQDEKGYTPLHIAATVGHKNIIALLVAFKANVHARTPEGQTAYNLAGDRRHERIANMLKAVKEKHENEKESDPTGTFRKKQSPAKSPLSRTTPDQRYAEGKTALHKAAEKRERAFTS